MQLFSADGDLEIRTVQHCLLAAEMRNPRPEPSRPSHASQALDPIARTALAALCRSSFMRLPGAALAPALDDLPLPPQAWAASSLQCFRYRAGSSGCEAHEDRALLTLLYAPGEPGLQVRRESWEGLIQCDHATLAVLLSVDLLICAGRCACAAGTGLAQAHALATLWAVLARFTCAWRTVACCWTLGMP